MHSHPTFFFPYRCLIRSHGSNKESLGGDGDPHVGIIGMGHFGKQLLMSLLEKTDIKPSNIKVSSRRPETAGENKTPKSESRHLTYLSLSLSNLLK